MPPESYKNLSIKKKLFLELAEIADEEEYPSVSALVHEALGAFVWMKKHGVPEKWLRRAKG